MRRLVAAAAALAFPCTAQAQDTDALPPGDVVVVTASRTGDQAGVEMVDAETIARRQGETLLDALGDVPGVRATLLGGPAGPSFLSIRGGEGNFTAVLIDGIRLNDPTNSEGGAFDFTLLDPATVERIEVARTAASAIHGSDALSGVVQIVTREPAVEGLDLGMSAWADTRAGGAMTASLSGGWGSGGILGSLAHSDSGDDDPAGTMRRKQVFARGRQTIGGYRLAALGLYAESRGTAFPQDSGGPLLAAIRTFERREGDLALAGLTLDRDPGERLRPSFRLGYALQHHDSDAPAIAPGALDGVPATVAHGRFARFEASGALTADLGTLTASAGGAILREDGRSDGALDFGFPVPVTFALTRVTHSGFAEASVRPAEAWTLSGALRFDDLSGGDGHWTGRAAVTWQARPGGVRAFARAASGYKLPSLYALGHPLIGNPGLMPEEGSSLEAGVEWPLPGGRLAFTLFDNRFRNLVDFDPIAFRLTNRARVETCGFELAALARLAEHWTLEGALTHAALDATTPLRGRPEWYGNARIVWHRGRWEATAAVRGNSHFHDSAIPTGALVTTGHVEADAGVRFAISDGVSLRVSVLNLGDNRSWTAVGTPAPGRSVRLALAFD
jgi:outer membrane cobalamin receptor